MGLDNMSIREMRLEECKRDLMNFKVSTLGPLYGNGPLGAQMVYSRNKCMTSYAICDSPNDIDRNIKRLNRLIELIETEEEEIIINNLYLLYTRYLRIFHNNKTSQLDDRLNNINKIFSELRRYDTFKNNQNVFDNFISLLKIQERLNYSRALNIVFKPDFVSDKTTSEDLEKTFREEIEKQFKNIVFLYNIYEEYDKTESEEFDIYELFN